VWYTVLHLSISDDKGSELALTQHDESTSCCGLHAETLRVIKASLASQGLLNRDFLAYIWARSSISTDQDALCTTMDFLASHPETDVNPTTIQATNAAFAPFLEKNRSKIEGVTRKTFQYGDTARHQLDIYYPPGQSSVKPPILFFVYGGGFFSGERVQPAPSDLLYKNVGAFFASRGILTVIPDYRLVAPGSDTTAVFPDPVTDVSKAIQYVVEHEGDNGNVDNIFISGHSAGANIVATLLLYNKAPATLPPNILKGLRGISLWGGAYHFNGPPLLPPPVFSTYFGTTDLPTIHKISPYGLLEQATPDVVKNLPPALFIMAEKEPAPVKECNGEFAKLYNEKTENTLPLSIAKAHNHISMATGLSSGEGEEFGEEIAKFIAANLK